MIVGLHLLHSQRLLSVVSGQRVGHPWTLRTRCLRAALLALAESLHPILDRLRTTTTTLAHRIQARVNAADIFLRSEAVRFLAAVAVSNTVAGTALAAPAAI